MGHHADARPNPPDSASGRLASTIDRWIQAKFRFTLALVAALAVAVAAPAAAPAEVQPYGTNDFGGFSDVLPPGANGLTNGPELAAFLANGTRPAHNNDQLSMYGDLVYAVPGLGEADFRKYFKDSTFGVREDDVARTYSPRADVTIVRDKGFGVPHVYGTTRAGAMFGLGYVAAEDRLFFIDVLRHLGRAELTTFAGGAAGNRALDEEQWLIAPYTEADMQRQVDQFDDLYGAEGVVIQQDIESYVAGINAYITEAKLNPSKMPGEYAAVGRPQGPDPWKATDVIATASLVGGIFGKGGGSELTQAALFQSFTDKYGARRGRRLWREWAAFEDPDAPTTVHEKVFRYQRPAKRPARDAVALPDRGSLERAEVVASGSVSSGAARGASGLLPRATLQRSSMSNALLVSARESASGRPLAVFGPQTGYFSPEILMEQDVHAPTIDARGAAFPGVNLYVQLGHGRDYAWSATSAGQDIIDVFAVDLCNQDGSAPTKASTSYLLRGKCTPFEVLEKTNSWSPSAADQTPPGSETLRVERTRYGIVIARGTVKGKPVVFTSLRSTYMHEVDSARGFVDFNDPDKMRNAADFKRAAAKIGYTFNWLYIDDRDIAYYNSGNNPVRAKGVDGQLPAPARHEWQGYDPETYLARYTPFAEHPQAVNQRFITSWNNKQARGYAGADTNVFSSVFRSDMLDQEIKVRIKGRRKITLLGLVDAMEEAGTTDLRGEKVLPLALEVIGTPTDPQLAAAVGKLRAWVEDGAHRRDKDRDGTYEHGDAIRILDAWWPRWLRAEFEPALGKDLFEQIEAAHGFDNEPNNRGDHLGSAYQNGWYGYAYKDLRTILGKRVRARYGLRYCGGGRLRACRAVLRSSLAEALEVPADEVYPSDAICAKVGEPNDQDCRDRVYFRPLGGVTQPLIHWINRPTYQQAVEIRGHRPR